ncbi:MAG TPA: tetratricopeptide repeat protein, partial [Lutibacter sp.]|nr:tetratricopeptide repeat protein [Lutibacter sp.]
MKLLLKLLILFIAISLQAQTKVDSILQTGNYLNAIEWLKTQDESATKYNELGNIYYEIGSFNKAINYYLKSEKISPSKGIKSKLAKAYKSNGNTSQAIAYYSKIIKKDSLNYVLLYKLGKLYTKTEQFKEASLIFDKLIAVDPNNANYLYQKALLQTNLYEQANLFLEVFKLDSLHTKSMYYLANFFRRIRDKDSARLFVNKALQINPYNTKFLPLKINDLYKQKKFEQALKHSLHLD